MNFMNKKRNDRFRRDAYAAALALPGGKRADVGDPGDFNVGPFHRKNCLAFLG